MLFLLVLDCVKRCIYIFFRLYSKVASRFSVCMMYNDVQSTTMFCFVHDTRRKARDSQERNVFVRERF
jgi:hypothetical protein